MNRVFNDYGVFHFVSQSFQPGSSESSSAGAVQRSVDDLMKRISTVIIDEDESDSFTIRVDAKGFHPSSVAVKKVHISASVHCEYRGVYSVPNTLILFVDSDLLIIRMPFRK